MPPFQFDLGKLIHRHGPLSGPGFQPEKPSNIVGVPFEECRVLVIGAGGLGCELLKDLSLSGFRAVDVIDMDTIDVSNLNRQFLFRQGDVGKPKAVVAAEYINRTMGNKVTITPHVCRIQEKDEAFYRQFSLIICGLDNIEARRWINGLVVGMVRRTEDGDPVVGDIIPIIDGGTEGFKGHGRVILPRITSCFECTLDLFPPQTTYPLCTIASNPRRPEHCVIWALHIHWAATFPDKAYDADSPEHQEWLFQHSLAHAQEYHIQSFDRRFALGVAKNIIPAIASTNAVIAGICAAEALKISTTAAPFLNNYIMYNGSEGVYSFTYETERNPECPVCGDHFVTVSLPASVTLQTLRQELIDNAAIRLTAPSLRYNGHSLYFAAPPVLEASTRPNLDRTLQSLRIFPGAMLDVTDPSLPSSLTVRLAAP